MVTPEKAATPLCHLHVTSTAPLSASRPAHYSSWVSMIALQPLKTWPFCHIWVREHYSSSMHGSSRATHSKQHASHLEEVENRYKKLFRMMDDPENMKKINEIQETSVFIREKKCSVRINKNYEGNWRNHRRWLSQLISNAKARKARRSYKRQRQSGKKGKYVGTLINEQ